jgi:hypothetical protein
MPFEARIVKAEEPPLVANGDLDLPPDLAALAEQLADDSTHLAASYPPTVAKLARRASEGFFATHPKSRRRTSILVATSASVAAGLAALLAGFVALTQIPVSDPPVHSPAPSSPPQFITTAAPSESIISLTELSSPEVEAILDLMERTPDNTIRVSF